MPGSVNPLVSVIIPAFNARAFLAEAIASARAQAAVPVDVVVIDDGSTDGTGTLAAGLGPDVRVIDTPHRGPSAARNTGIGAAYGDLVAFLDADDLWPADSLRSRIAALMVHPACDVAIGLTQVLVHEPGGGQPPRYVPLGAPWWACQVGSYLVRRRVFAPDRVGRFDESLRHGEDVDWTNRAREHGVKVAHVDSVACYYRLHRDNLTADVPARHHGLLAAAHRAIQRKRQSVS